MDLPATPSPNATPTPGLRRSPSSGWLFFVSYAALAWTTYWLWIHFQLLEMRARDYVALIALSLLVAGLALLRWGGVVQRPNLFLERGSLFLITALFTYFVGGAALLTANAAFDRGVAQTVTTTVANSHCSGRSSYYHLSGGPDLRTADHTATLDFFLSCASAREGDVVILRIKPGFLQQPWIAGYQVSGE
jgi:hypothetical protein